MSNKFDIYSSKVKRVNIPIPEFKFFHKASSEEKVDSKFIGREQISDKLYSWLKDDSTGGSYLVTGFRGMGKSSFVGRVLNQLSKRITGYAYIVGLFYFLSLFFFVGIIFLLNYMELPDIMKILLGGRNDMEESGENNLLKLCFVVLIMLVIPVIIIYFYKIQNSIRNLRFKIRIGLEYLLLSEKYLSGKTKQLRWYNNKPFTFIWIKGFVELLKSWRKLKKIDWKRACHILHHEYYKNISYKRICVNVNLGQEVLNEREVLSLISHQLYTKYREYVLSPIANVEHWLFYTIILSVSSFASMLFFKISEKGVPGCFIIPLCLVIISLFIYCIAQLFSSSQSKILNRLRLLNQRLDAQVSFDENYNSRVGYGTTNLGTGVQKKRVYDVANVREIEQELIDVLDNISRGFFKCPSFVVVFDELDKVDSNSISGALRDTKAEFTNEKNFPGGGTTRRRKQNVLHLLANMKLFVSTAKAKFIFISGRELYDAFLADLSDREFAVSSIFSGVIYVDSFCVNEHKEKDVMSNVETYICRQLIPQKYIRKQFARYYALELMKGPAFERFDINLKLYYQYLVDEYKNVPHFSEAFLKKDVDENKKEDDKNVNKEQDNDKEEFTNEEMKAYLHRCYVDKAVNLLYHFSVYLYHISNGSPKKMMLYFEKYVRCCYDKNMFNNLQDVFSNPNPDAVINIHTKRKAKFYLSFGYIDQRKIGFIHYISYPVNQILVNANQYSDKLLVSVSFLIDHIYKFHNSGFSWRNLEYTPELLEVYKIPGFRSFINSIISYLKQTHLITVTCGLYQFRFRKQIAEEISLASKLSEEIAALFNFTLDESLNVKQHYFDIRNAYLELEGRGDEQTPKHTPRLSIGLHNILGDLYMFDEEYNNAIFEYHAAVKELETAMEKKNKDNPDLRNTLYSIRLLLKLGLANEKRNTNESALVVYNELVAKLLKFRQFDEKKLQLTYRLHKHDDWPPYEGVLIPQKYDKIEDLDFNAVHPRIINDSSPILHHANIPFMAKGQNLSTDFSHLLTPDKYSIIQRISLFQDIRLIYQALLAKLFVKEKMDLGGITMTDIETIESEFIYLNLANNINEKFLTSSDFFRRLGDIMFYKNGLSATSLKNSENPNNDISFVNGLYFWGYDIKRELKDFCNVNNCYEHYEMLLKYFQIIENKKIKEKEKEEKGKKEEKKLHKILHDIIIQIVSKEERLYEFYKKRNLLSLFFEDNSPHIKYLEHIPTKEVMVCNEHRQKMFNCNSPVPCMACNYYNRSLRLLIRGMFNCDILELRNGKSCSVFIIMKKILVKGTSRSLRQDYVLQLAEILDCRANVMLSCATGGEDSISKKFMDGFIYFIKHIEEIEKDYSYDDNRQQYNESVNEKIEDFEEIFNEKRISKIEECILYYWEASKCFSIGNDLMKASASLKKVLRIFQNYLKTSNSKDRIDLVYNNIENLKYYFVKPCLIHLYSHYDNINFAEIQKLKWIFSVQTYEAIPLNRLSLFPDVEQILLLYFDLLRRCVMTYCTEVMDRNSKKVVDENRIKNQKLLSKLYRNTTLVSLRQDSTIYERVMALRLKTLMNMDLLHVIKLDKDLYYNKEHETKFVEFFIEYVNSEKELSKQLGEFMNCFRFAFQPKKESDNQEREKNKSVDEKLYFLEFLVRDSLFCIARILEIITPHTTSTLFSSSFYGEIYQMLYEWNMFFDEFFMIYKYLENATYPISVNTNRNTYDNIVKAIKKIYESNEKIEGVFTDKMNDFMSRNPLPSEKFFNESLHEIGKAQVNLTLAKYSLAMAKESYEKALQMHHEGKAYKDMISQMYYLDDDLKNDTIQFGTAVERYKINNGYIQKQLKNIMKIIDIAPMYDLDNFIEENMNKMGLENRFYGCVN